ncbi:F-box domain-containing protein [Mycena sanguinolenta]|uniref:F-box domain-containing protein n=1 Tax=Mycena sanguinolenta TaxID=230812 RepID=A0A8H7D3B0_9AGAR|nr:F-box domain-containing protein [Mycena sanguinolenta]
MTLISMHAIPGPGNRKNASSITQPMAESDFEITSFQNEITALESQAATELRCAAGAVPIRTLPVELFAEILVLTIRTSDSDVFDSLHIQDAFRVSHVCRYWRQIANGTPYLWTGPIQVDFSRQRDSADANGLRTWLERSAPLSVPVMITGFRHRSWLTESSSRLNEELLRVASRWRSLSMQSIHFTGQAWFVQQLAGRRLDSLEELELSTLSDGRSHLDLTTSSPFPTAPRLRKVAFDMDSGIPMPWAQLTDMTLTGKISPEGFLDIFSQCTNVVRASIIIAGWSVVLPPVPTNVLMLNHLHVLSVTWPQVEFQFLDCLSAPALDELCICIPFQSSGGSGEWKQPTFTAFQRRSPHMTKLEIDANGFFRAI